MKTMNEAPAELTEDSPEVVLAAAWWAEEPCLALSSLKSFSFYRDRTTKVVAAARKLAAEGKLGPAPTPDVGAFRARVLEYLDCAAQDGERLARERADGFFSQRAYAFRLAARTIREMAPVEAPETWKPTGDYRPHETRRVWIWSHDAKDGVHLPTLQQKWRSDRGHEEWRDVEIGE